MVTRTPTLPEHLSAIAAAWREAEARQFSACNHCEHNTWRDARLCCGAPALMYGGVPRPVEFVRMPHGGCGPEAVHMQAAWLRT